MVVAADYCGSSDFVPLHVHSQFSLLDGIPSLSQYAVECAGRGWGGMAITEHGHMGSVPDFYMAFESEGLKPIFGCEIYLNDYEPERQRLVSAGVKIRSIEWRLENPELAYRINRNRHLTVLAKDRVGFHNLLKLTTQAYETGLYGLGRTQYNRIWFDKLCEFREGLIVLSGCLNGPVSHELRFKEVKNRNGDVVGVRDLKCRLDSAFRMMKQYKAVFGDDYYVELQMPGIEDDEDVFRQLIVMADLLKIPLVLTNDTHYLKREDFILQKIMMAIEQETTVDSPDLFHVNSDEQYLKTRAELWERFSNFGYSKGVDSRLFESMCDNTLLIFDRVEQFKLDSDPKIPQIPHADSVLMTTVLRRLVELGLDKCSRRFLVDNREVTYVEQCAIEMRRFIEKGFSSYFLITKDLIQYGLDQGWLFMPRGSASGSLVCYLLGISNIDPLKFGLSFDRFLSPARGGYMLNLRMGTPIKA